VAGEADNLGTRLLFSRSRTSSTQLIDLIGSIFALELLCPGQELYLISPWITDVPILRNRTAELRALLPEQATGDIWLSRALAAIAEHGTAVNLICRPDQPTTEEFLTKLPGGIAVRKHKKLHMKGLFTEQAALIGSMNFTYSGLNLNDELVELKTANQAVAQALFEARTYWSNLS
jgi:phosphatidylserine/phosphatidylglycerophosphate/cardiolipin synthase-like enzyme